jgi:hypothetical protein
VTGQVQGPARLFGFAGLLPQIAVVVMIAFGNRRGDWAPSVVDYAAIIGIAYPLTILCFIGGIWWGLAMRSEAGQGPRVAVAVVPSLAALVLPLVVTRSMGWAMVAIGSAILLTLIVDRRIVARGDAPVGWMGLRIPLSVGLGGLTIIGGVLLGR